MIIVVLYIWDEAKGVYPITPVWNKNKPMLTAAELNIIPKIIKAIASFMIFFSCCFQSAIIIKKKSLRLVELIV